MKQVRTKTKKNKSLDIPLADYGLDLNNLNKQKSNATDTTNNNSNITGITGVVTGGVNAITSTLQEAIPSLEDHISGTGKVIQKGAHGVLGALSESPEPISKMIGMVGNALVDPVTMMVNTIKKNIHPDDPLKNIEYKDQYNNTKGGSSFGNLLEFALGGFSTTNQIGDNKFVQYSANSHEEGGQDIDSQMNPTNNSNEAVANIEKNENSYKNFIFSDNLEIKPNITFADMAARYNRKYGKKEDIISKRTLDYQLIELMKKNEQAKAIKQQEEQAQHIMKHGGIVKAKEGLQLDTDQPLAYNWTSLNKDINPFGNGNKMNIRNSIHEEDYKNTSTSPYNESLIDEITRINKGQELPYSKPSFNWTTETGTQDNTSQVQSKNTTKKISKLNMSPEEMAGYAIKAGEAAGSIAMAFQKPDLVNPVQNPESDKIKQLMSNRKIDEQSIIDSINLESTAAKRNIDENASSVGVKLANLQKNEANTYGTLAKTKLEEQAYNNTYRGEEANVLNNLGEQNVKASQYAEVLNNQAKATSQANRSASLHDDIGGVGDFLLKKAQSDKYNNFESNVTKEMGINFKASDWKTWSKSGVDILKFDGAFTSETDKAKRAKILEDVKAKLKASGISDNEIENMTNTYKSKV